MSSHGGFRGGKKLSKANSHTYKAVLTIDQLKPDMNGFNITVMVVKIVIDTFEVSGQQGTKVTTYLVADRTGSIEYTLWGDDHKNVKEGDVLQLSPGQTTVFADKLQITLAKHGQLKKTGQFTFPAKLEPNYTVIYSQKLDVNNNNNSHNAHNSHNHQHMDPPNGHHQFSSNNHFQHNNNSNNHPNNHHSHYHGHRPRGGRYRDYRN